MEITEASRSATESLRSRSLFTILRRAFRGGSVAAVSAGIGAVLLSSCAFAQDRPDAPPPETVPPRHEEIRVVAPTPVDGMPIDEMHFPGNLRRVSAQEAGPAGITDATDLLGTALGSVHLSDPQASAFEPDVLFRGFESSPLLGAPQGISVYQDGVRLNETFGDSVHWALIPAGAIASIDVLPGSDPLFGQNTLGGAISVHTKNGFSDPATTARLSGGSFGRREAVFETGGHAERIGWFVAVDTLAEDGWRQDSPARLARAFADASWRSATLSMDLSANLASTRISGNGTAPESLLATDRTAAFTHPDVSTTRDALVSWRSRAAISASATLVANVSARWTRPKTVNGDVSPFFPCRAAGSAGLLCGGDEAGPTEAVVRDQLGRPVPSDGLDAALNRTAARETETAATLQVETRSRIAGLSNQIVVGASAEDGRTRFESSTELASFDSARLASGSGLSAATSTVRLRSATTNLAAFFSDALSLTSSVTLTAGGRFDRSNIRLTDEIGTALDGRHRLSRFNPTAGLTWQIADTRVAFASYSEGFRTPTPVELTCADPGSPCRLPNAFVSDPPLRAVVARTVEGGMRGRETFGSWSLAAFRTTTADDILFVSNGAARGQGHFENVGRTRRQGVELDLSGSRGRWSWFLAYTLLDARFESAFIESSPDHPDAIDGVLAVRPGDRIPSLPLHNLKAGARGRLSSRWNAGAQAVFLSSQYLRGDEANRLRPLAGQFRVDLDLGFALDAHCLLFVKAANVLDRHDAGFGQVGNASGVPGDLAADDRFVSPAAPRIFRAGVQLRL